MNLAFADNPSGSGPTEPPDASGRRDGLLHTAWIKETRGPDTCATDLGRLLEAVASETNLAKALKNVIRNKGAPGLDGQTVKKAEAQAPTLIADLRRDLLAECYRPGAVRRVWLPKPGGGQRGLGIPNVIDRVVQQAVLQVLEPIFDPHFHASSHGFRAKRGAHTAVAQAKAYLEEGYRVVVDIDLAKFFDRVHHQRLLARLGTRVSDPRIVTLVHRMLTAPVVMPDGTTQIVREGTPQGGPLSPLLSNIVLDEMDQELERRGLRFVRYADDSNIFVRSERAGRRVMASLRRFLETRMRLQINEAKSAVRKPEDVHFLGFRFRLPNVKTGGKVAVLPSAKAIERVKETLRDMTPPNWGRPIAACMVDLETYLRGWMSHFRLCTSEALREMDFIDAHLRRRIRAIIVRHKKRANFLFRHLVGRGVRTDTAAACAFGGTGPWVKSNQPAMQRAYPVSWFEERMGSLKAFWKKLNPPQASGQLSLAF